MSKFIRVNKDILIGRNDSDSVIVCLNDTPYKYSNFLRYAALIGPCCTDMPGVKQLFNTLKKTEVKKIFIVGRNTFFDPKSKIIKEAKKKKYTIYDGLKDIRHTWRKTKSNIKFVYEDDQSNYTDISIATEWETGGDKFAFKVIIMAEEVFLDIFRNRKLAKKIKGTREAVLKYVSMHYKLSYENWCWLVRRLWSSRSLLDFPSFQDAYFNVIQYVFEQGRKIYNSDPRKAIIDKSLFFSITNPISLTIKDLKICQIPIERAKRYVNYFMGKNTRSIQGYLDNRVVVNQYHVNLSILRKNKYSRYAYFTFVDPPTFEPTGELKPQSCPHIIYIKRLDQELHMNVVMRANDPVRAMPFDIYAFITLGNQLANDLNLKFTSYHHFINAATLYYERDETYVRNLLRLKCNLCKKGELSQAACISPCIDYISDPLESQQV